MDAFAGNGPAELRSVVLELRVPRTALAGIAGSALGVAGAVVQSITRNPLAEPGLFGVNAGAAFAIALLVVGTGANDPSLSVLVAFLGAFSVVALLVLLTLRGSRTTMHQVTLVGIATASVLGGATSALSLVDPLTFTALRSWLAGSVDRGGAPVPVVGIVAVLCGFAVLVPLVPSLRMLELGHASAKGLGVRVQGVTVLALVVVALTAGAATAMAGSIALVGLVAPHAARVLAPRGLVSRLVLSALLGASVLIVADVIGRVILPAGEVPAGIVAAFIGGPVLIAVALDVLARGRR